MTGRNPGTMVTSYEALPHVLPYGVVPERHPVSRAARISRPWADDAEPLSDGWYYAVLLANVCRFDDALDGRGRAVRCSSHLVVSGQGRHLGHLAVRLAGQRVGGLLRLWQQDATAPDPREHLNRADERPRDAERMTRILEEIRLAHSGGEGLRCRTIRPDTLRQLRSPGYVR